MARNFSLTSLNDCIPVSGTSYEYGFGSPAIQSGSGYSYVTKGGTSGIQLLQSASVSISGTTGSNSGNTTSTQPTFTGSSGTTGGTTPTFTGTAGTTGSKGSNTSFSILPPYVVKYCFERTA